MIDILQTHGGLLATCAVMLILSVVGWVCDRRNVASEGRRSEA